MDRPSYSERQAQYAAWRDRLRKPDDDADADVASSDDADRWTPEALFAESAVVDLTDEVTVDLTGPADPAAAETARPDA